MHTHARRAYTHNHHHQKIKPLTPTPITRTEKYVVTVTGIIPIKDIDCVMHPEDVITTARGGHSARGGGRKDGRVAAPEADDALPLPKMVAEDDAVKEPPVLSEDFMAYLRRKYKIREVEKPVVDRRSFVSTTTPRDPYVFAFEFVRDELLDNELGLCNFF